MEMKELNKFLDNCYEEINKIKDSILFKQNEENLNKIRAKISMVIRRVYPNYDEVEKKLLPHHPRIYCGSSDDDQDRSYYDMYVIDTIRAIEIIKEELSLFGFEDFTPIKEKTETEFQLGSKNLGGFWRKKKTK